MTTVQISILWDSEKKSLGHRLCECIFVSVRDVFQIKDSESHPFGSNKTESHFMCEFQNVCVTDGEWYDNT